MKKTINLAAALGAITLLAGCTENIPSGIEKEYSEALLTVSLSPSSTKFSADEESAISGIQIFVFDSKGDFETKKSGDSPVLELSCTQGRKTIWALAAAPSLNPATERELLETVTRLEDNAPGAFVMSGSRSLEVSGSTSVEITIKRYVARVSLGRITNSLSGVYASREFVVRGVYLTNVAGNTTYGLSAPTLWYNKMGKDSNPAETLISCSGVSDGEYTFYPYPNPSESDASGGTWSSRHTKLVVEASIGGAICYYPIVLPVLQRNKTYTITELTVTMPGSDNPDIPIDKGSLNFNILVEDWETGQAPHSEII